MMRTKKARQYVLIMAVCLGLTVLGYGVELDQARDEIANGILRGKTENEVYQDTYIAKTEDGEKLEIPVTIYPRELSEEEKKEVLEQAVSEFEKSYLAGNISAEEVTEDLQFQSRYADGMVQAVFESDHPDILWEDGSISREAVDKEGELVMLTVLFTCQNQSLEHTCCVYILPPESPYTNGVMGRIREAVDNMEEATRQNTYFELPDEVEGNTVVWNKKQNHSPLIIAVLGVISAVCISQKSVQDKRQKQKNREKELLREYPAMIMQMSLLMGAGMTAMTAWERMVKRYVEDRAEDAPVEGKHCKGKKFQKWHRKGDRESTLLYMEEMLITYREIRDGCGTRKSWEQFGRRIGLTPYRKFASLLIQNMDKGVRDTVFLLDQEADQVLEEQKNSARRMGEEAGTKLLLPMFMMLLVILLMIMVPALMSF